MQARVTNYQFKDWHISTAKGRIQESKGERREKYERDLNLPHLPDMLFADNFLRLKHKNGFGLEFKAYDSLLNIDPNADLIKVSVAKEWKESRADQEFIDKLIHPFDWTFTTSYRGSLISDRADGATMTVSETDERINMDKLRVQETICFFDEVSLFDDELSDHGIASLDLKIRVMPASFYILQRFFLRVDNVVIRVYETRIHHETDKNYMIREYSEKESLVEKLTCAPKVFTEPNEVVNFLPLKSRVVERLDFPVCSEEVSQAVTETIPQTDK
jgi:type 2A phosphatase activator TIP41